MNVNAIPKTMSVGKENHFYLSLSEPVSLECLKVQLHERFMDMVQLEGTFFSSKNYSRPCISGPHMTGSQLHVHTFELYVFISQSRSSTSEAALWVVSCTG